MNLRNENRDFTLHIPNNLKLRTITRKKFQVAQTLGNNAVSGNKFQKSTK